MTLLNGRLVTAMGIILMIASLMAFSLSAPDIALGQTTDTGDVGAGSQPPASLPAAGISGGIESGSSVNLLLVTLLAASGVTLAGAGFVANRRGWLNQRG